MDSGTIIVLIGAILGSSVISSIVTGVFSKSKSDADAVKVLQDMWHADLDRLKCRVTKLEEELCGREAIIEKLMEENRQLRAELEDLKQKYERQVSENRRLGDRIYDLTKANSELLGRVRVLEQGVSDGGRS